jgi:choline dehydrogenase
MTREVPDLYDVLVVGAGSAGCALARRLSDSGDLRVGLIEAGGPDDHPDIHTPATYYRLWGSELDWDYESVPQPGTRDRIHRLPRGRVLGGTSAINGMVYLRGAREDFDGWAGEGCVGWGWDDVRRAYEELERLVRPAVAADCNPLSRVFVDAAVQAGLPFNDDFDDGVLDGCGWNRSSIHDGRRQSAYRAFVHDVLDRPNLDVLSGVEVQRLQVSPAGRVTGVQAAAVTQGQRLIQAGEVIVCAGAYDSPRLLMRSGIGPPGHLQAAGVTPLVELPVGENLQDHLLVGVVYSSSRPILPSHAHITESCAFARSSRATRGCDIEISFNKEMHFAPEQDDELPRYTIIPGITHLRSRGSVKLPAAGEPGRVVVDHAYFTEPEDMAAMIEAVRLTRRIGAAAPLQEWSDGEFFPGPEVETDEQIADYVRSYVSTWFHPAGSCRMGIGADSVVDPQLRVRGTTGLRIADASIMPTVVSVNTNAASMMIGWKAAEIVLGGSDHEPDDLEPPVGTDSGN